MQIELVETVDCVLMAADGEIRNVEAPLTLYNCPCCEAMIEVNECGTQT